MSETSVEIKILQLRGERDRLQAIITARTATPSTQDLRARELKTNFDGKRSSLKLAESSRLHFHNLSGR